MKPPKEGIIKTKLGEGPSRALVELAAGTSVVGTAEVGMTEDDTTSRLDVAVPAGTIDVVAPRPPVAR